MAHHTLGEFNVEQLGKTPDLIFISMFAEQRLEAYYETLQHAAENKQLHDKKRRTHHRMSSDYID